MKNQVRAFIAVDLSASVRSSVVKLIKSIEPHLDGTKWVSTENLHVTLKFLGDVPLNELPALIKAIQKGTEQVDAFDLEFLGCGAFPNLTAPKTIWIGCDQGADDLTFLASRIEDELFTLGYPKESRKFSPHLTIGRVRKSSAASVLSLTEFFTVQKQKPFGSCGVDEVVIYSSELTRQGPIYDVLATVPLK